MKLIGYYNYTVILTNLSLISSVFGIYMAMRGYVAGAVYCLMVSGFCDMFDGKAVSYTHLDATTGKNAVSQAKEFNESADISGIVPVSYTHLDVYKRQLKILCERGRIKEGEILLSGQDLVPPVSYTHLFFHCGEI